MKFHTWFLIPNVCFQAYIEFKFQIFDLAWNAQARLDACSSQKHGIDFQGTNIQIKKVNLECILSHFEYNHLPNSKL